MEDMPAVSSSVEKIPKSLLLFSLYGLRRFLIRINAQNWKTCRLGSITGPTYALALVCLFVFTACAIALMVLWTQLWISCGPLGGFFFYISALAGIVPRVLILMGVNGANLKDCFLVPRLLYSLPIKNPSK